MKRLIVDMDDVLANTSKKILKVINDHSEIKYSEEFFDDKSFYDFMKTQNYTAVREALLEPGFFRDLEVFENAPEILKELSTKYEIFIVSAAVEFPNSLIDKYHWLGEHFPFISWSNIVFCGDKSIVHGDVMIDDHTRNFANFNGDKLLYHAIHNTLETGFTRVKNWNEIYSILK